MGLAVMSVPFFYRGGFWVMLLGDLFSLGYIRSIYSFFIYIYYSIR